MHLLLKTLLSLRLFWAWWINVVNLFIIVLLCIVYPLYKLLKKSVKGMWCFEYQNSCHKIELRSKYVLVHYDLNLPIKWIVALSQYGLGALFSHIYPGKTETPSYSFCFKSFIK